jgi:hypothetical protein
LLCGRNNPDLAIAYTLEILGKSIKIEDKVVARGYVLADLVDHKDDVLFSALLANDIDHLLDLLVL